MTRSIARLVLILSAAWILASCSTVPEARSSATITHVVVCWLKEPGSEAARARLIEASQSLRTIPGVLHVQAGRPLPSSRTQVDSSFDVALVVTFASEQALRDYEKHPTHQQAVKEVLLPLVSRFIVYDFTQVASVP